MPGQAVVEQMTRDHTRTALYAWIIDRDHLDEEFPNIPGGSEVDSEVDSEVGTTGPSHAPRDLLDKLNAGEGVTFQMYDDDGELYYTGRILAYDDCDRTALQSFPNCGDEFFGPLWDFGTPNAGAVAIKYQRGAVWVAL